MTGSSSTSIRFSCSSCSGRVKVPLGQAGQKCRCPRCDAELVAPAAVADQGGAPDPFADDEFFSLGDSPSSAGYSSSTPPTTGAIESLDDAPHVRLPDAEPARSWAETAAETPISVSIDDELIELPLSIDKALDDDLTSVDDDGATDLLLGKKPVTPPLTASSPAAPSPASPSRVADVAPTQFGLECGLCGTRVYATPDQIGRELACPDCHSKIPVLAPRKAAQPAQAMPVHDDSDDYRLSDLVERPKSALVERVTAASAGDGGPRPVPPRPVPAKASSDIPSQAPPKQPPTIGSSVPGLGVMAAAARSVLGKANAEAAEVERKRAKLPARPFLTGVVSFLFEGAAATRWIVLTLMLHMTVTLLGYAFSDHFAAVLFSMVAAASALLYLVTASVCYVAILHDTANGYEKIEGWPGVAFLDWMGDSLYVINGLFASATPGILLGQVFSCAGAPRLVAFLGSLFTFYCLFPVFLLSMSDQGSPLSIASGGVWRSLLTARSLWRTFYLASAGIIGAALVGVTMTVNSGFMIGIFATAVVVALSMVYFRLLGRLAWCLSELDK